MKSRIIAVFLLAAMTVTFFACADLNAREASDTGSVGVGTDEVENMTYTGRLVIGKSSYIIVDDKDNSPIVMNVDGSAEEFFAGFNTGDRIEVVSSPIEMTYPGQAFIYHVKSIEKGSESDVPFEAMSRLRELGWID